MSLNLDFTVLGSDIFQIFLRGGGRAEHFNKNKEFMLI